MYEKSLDLLIFKDIHSVLAVFVCIIYKSIPYMKGVRICANQPTKRFHTVRFLYSSLVSKVLDLTSSSNKSISS